MNKKALKKSRLNNEKGMALIETVPILVIFIILIAYGLGFFGIVHTGVLNSISARAYAFETFRNRANLVYFRDRRTGEGFSHFANIGTRFHTINSELKAGPAQTDGQFATTRPLTLGRRAPDAVARESDHNERVYSIERRNRKGGVETSPAWIMVGYGICINAGCGD